MIALTVTLTLLMMATGPAAADGGQGGYGGP